MGLQAIQACLEKILNPKLNPSVELAICLTNLLKMSESNEKTRKLLILDAVLKGTPKRATIKCV